jgi:hypothetical protein
LRRPRSSYTSGTTSSPFVRRVQFSFCSYNIRAWSWTLRRFQGFMYFRDLIVFTGRQHLRRKTADYSIRVASESQFPVKWSFEYFLQFTQCGFYYLIPLFILPFPNYRVDVCSLSCVDVNERTNTSLRSLKKIKFVFVRILVVLSY